MTDALETREAARPKRTTAWWCLATLLGACAALFFCDATGSILSGILNRTDAAAPPGVKTPIPARLPLHWLMVQEWLVCIHPYVAGVILPRAILFLRAAGLTILLALGAFVVARTRSPTPRRLTTHDLLRVAILTLVVAAVTVLVVGRV
ncbi:MAG: hypothetical protein K8T25_09860 [Planctomycetia bacterium]|nr:hypothetical protein [Planctomycetia bacterium]